MFKFTTNDPIAENNNAKSNEIIITYPPEINSSINLTATENATSSEIHDGEKGNIVIETGSLQHYVTADNVIIEHIELAEGETAKSIDPVDEDSSQSEEEPTLDHWVGTLINKWTTKDKKKLLKALELYDIDDYAQISTRVPSKSLKEITDVIQEIKKIAEERIRFREEYKPPTRCRPKRQETDPLTDWIDKLNDNFTPEELDTVTADALRLISECENFPSPAETTNVDFKQIHYALACVMEGRPFPDLSDESLEVMRRAMTEVSIIATNLKGKECDHYISSLTSLQSRLLNQIKEIDKKCMHRYKLANLCNEKAYNPINVPTELLNPHYTKD